jgi:hypothetical protein
MRIKEGAIENIINTYDDCDLDAGGCGTAVAAEPQWQHAIQSSIDSSIRK